MARFSQIFDLKKSQAQLDFVDVDPTVDTPLFLDPFALSIKEDDWSVRCTQHIVSFFQTAITAIKNGNPERAKAILRNLSEPNETCLGLSRGHPSGRGVGNMQAFDLYEALSQSEAARTGVLSELAECDLFIPGIAHDKISDITTNIIRRLLAEYTKAQCLLNNIPLSPSVPLGMAWDMDRETWVTEYAELPVCNNKKILLVPKASVRLRMCLDSQEYYNHHMLEYLQAEHLHANSSLVEVLKNGARRVTKKSLKEIVPFDKKALFEFTKEHPQVLETYKQLQGASGTLSNQQLDIEFNESLFAKALGIELRNIPPGSEAATDFHRFMIGALEFIFYPHLLYPKKEREIDQGRKRIDITYTNGAESGFFYRAHTSHQITSISIMVECKNYSADIGNEELDQLTGRFSTNRGKLGLLISRSFANRNLFIQRCRDTAQAGRGFVIPLVDDDVYSYLTLIESGQRAVIDQRLEGILNELIS